DTVEEALAVVFRVEPARQPRRTPLGLFLGLDPVPHAFRHAGRALRLVPEDVRMAADHLFRDHLDRVGEGELAVYHGHAGVKHGSTQRAAQALEQVVHVDALDDVGDNIDPPYRVGIDGGEILLHVPRAAGLGLAQRRHDLDKPRYVLA